jgi:hypothetical protein
MEFTPTFNFPCPDGTDYADLAIYMQSLAEKLEAKILAQRSQMTAVDTQPVAVFYNSFAMGPVSSGSINSFLNIDNVYFTNYKATIGFGSTAFTTNPAFDYVPQYTFPRSGLYLVGYTVATTNTGAVTDGSKRKVYASVIRTSTSGTTTELMNFSSEVFASNIANLESFGSCGLVYLSDQDFSLSGVLLAFSHNDGASTVNIAPGAFIAYIQRIGSADLIEVT